MNDSPWKRRARHAAWGLVAAGLAASGPAQARDIDDLPLAWERGRLDTSHAPTVGTFSAAPSGVTPPQGARALRFGTVRLDGGRDTRFALDTAPGLERAWVDTDRDGRFDDERPLRWLRRGLRLEAAVDVPLTVPGMERKVDVHVRLVRPAFDDPDSIRLEVGSHRWGATLAGGKLVQVALQDGDGNLRLDDEGEDVAFVDLDGDGAFDLTPGSLECCTVGSVVKLGREAYRVEPVGELGRALRLTPVAPELRKPGAGSRPPLPVPGKAWRALAGDAAELRAIAASSRDATRRVAALAELGHAGDVETAEFLVEQAVVGDALAVRTAAVRALGNPAYRAIGGRVLLEQTKDRRYEVARAAVVALHAQDHPDRLAAYEAMFEHAAMPVVRLTARVLAEMSDKKAGSLLLRTVKNHPSRNVRREAYFGARESALGVSLGAMLAAAEDEHARLAVRALRDLFALRHPRTRKLSLEAVARHAKDLTGPLLPILAAYGDDACVAALWDAARRQTFRPRALELLGRMDGAARTFLIDRLQNGEPQERDRALTALSHTRDPRTATTLLDHLKTDPEPALRERILRVLGARGEERALEYLDDLVADGAREERLFAFRHLGSPVLRGHPKVDAILIRELASPEPYVRALAVEAVRNAGAVELLPEVTSNLDHGSRRVRHAVAVCLGELRRRENVRPLIEQLQVEPQAWVRAAIGEALFKLTGQNLYDEPAIWQRWWEDHAEDFVVPDEIPTLPSKKAKAGPGSTFAAEAPRFYGIPLLSESIVFVIDRSGSMSTGTDPAGGGDDRLQTASAQLLSAVEEMDDGSRVNIVYFDSTVQVWRNKMQVLSSTIRRRVKTFVGRQRPDGATNLYGALDAALQIKGVETIVVLSDGEPTTGELVNATSILAAVQETNRKRAIRIHCVSVGRSSTLLRRLAAMHRGEYVEH